jgi:ribosome-associated translation inhibitor RaiA
MNAFTAPPFPIYIRGLEGDFRPEERAFLRHKLTRRLKKFAESIERVSLRTEDVNGPRGGVDRVCRIKVVLRGMSSIVVEKQDAFLNAAAELALAGVERGVRRAVTRRRTKPLRRPQSTGMRLARRSGAFGNLIV